MTVILISRRVFLFRTSYIHSDKYYKRFHFLLFSFVLSIVILILSPNLIRILLGWDGLGIRSYLLVIYYSRRKSYNAGIITFLSNRLGDALIIVSIRYLCYLRNLNLYIIFFELKLELYWVIFLIVVARCTKRAQIPFSAWLPAAIAAPTPVSSLVHSSTLVTAGVYLIFRFENLIGYLNINRYLLILGCLTIFMARLRAFFEIDIKKIVALSTLRQLGVIIAAIGAGFRLLGFFHLLTHAFFKALLFIRAGHLIHSSESYQDLRVMGGISEIMPFRARIIIGSSFSLCGLPFISAFYSKEIIIERILIYNLSFFSYFIILFGILITVFYSIRFLTVAIAIIRRQRSLFIKTDLDFKTNFSILILFIPAITGGRTIRQKIESFSLFRLIIILTSLFFFYIFYKTPLFFFNKFIWRLSSIWGLPFFSSRLPIQRRINLGDFFNKISDFSWVYYIFSEFLFYNFYKLETLIFIFFKKSYIRIINILFIFILIILFIIY